MREILTQKRAKFVKFYPEKSPGILPMRMLGKILISKLRDHSEMTPSLFNQTFIPVV